ncbi:hypothetical protein HDU98_000396 [Podochytrium sp. JEL0797]|nr:hypothetical protein HDU98_000396 [Podochytrium sp. JEL0797]
MYVHELPYSSSLTSVGIQLTGAGLTAVCANLAGYNANFTACVTSEGGCSASGSMTVSQAEALLPAIQAACASSSTPQAPTSNPSTAYANQISKRKTMAYLTEYADINIIRNANLANMDVLIYAFIHLGPDGSCSFGASSMTNINFALAQRASFPNLQVVLSVGATAQVFTSATSTAVTRAAFAQNCVGLMNQVNADGLDIDWEFPQASDAANLLATVQLLRAILGSTKTLSFVTSAHISNVINPALPSLAPYLDWYGVMSYSYGNIGLQSSSATTSDLDNIVRTLLSVGLQPSQIVIGIAFYGFTCKLPSNGDPTILVNCVAASDNAVLVNGAAGTSVFNNFTFAQYTFLPNGTVLIYNTPQSAQLKAQYVVDHALCGLMIWEFSQDSTFAMYNTISSHVDGNKFDVGCNPNNKPIKCDYFCLFGGNDKPIKRELLEHVLFKLYTFLTLNGRLFNTIDYLDDCEYHRFLFVDFDKLFELLLHCKFDVFRAANGHCVDLNLNKHTFFFLFDCDKLFEFDVFLTAGGHRVDLNRNKHLLYNVDCAKLVEHIVVSFSFTAVNKFLFNTNIEHLVNLLFRDNRIRVELFKYCRKNFDSHFPNLDE